MRLVSFVYRHTADTHHAAAPHCGLLVGAPDHDQVLDLSKGLEAEMGIVLPLGMRSFLRLGSRGLELAKELEQTGKFRVSLHDVELDAPIRDCDKVICIGMNYVDHCTEQDYPIPTEPVVFSKFSSSITRSGADIILPPETQKLDFEVELAIVIGKECRRVSKEQVREVVAGFTVAHDVSARDWQLEKNGGQWLLGKTCDTFSPIGPSIVTWDEISDPHSLGIRCYVNGQEMQNSNTDQLIFKTEELVEWCSKFFTLYPGDLIFTGTPPGVGCFRKPPTWLKHGDVVTCEIDKIGKITNTVRAEEQRTASKL